jgi:hypothetical protein
LAKHAVGCHGKCLHKQPRTFDGPPILNVLISSLQESRRCSGPPHAHGRRDFRFSNGLVGKEVVLLGRTVVLHWGQPGLVPISCVLLGLGEVFFSRIRQFLLEDVFAAACFWAGMQALPGSTADSIPGAARDQSARPVRWPANWTLCEVQGGSPTCRRRTGAPGQA